MARGNNIPEKQNKAKQEWGRVSVQTLLQAKGSQEVIQTRADMDKPVMCYVRPRT